MDVDGGGDGGGGGGGRSEPGVSEQKQKPHTKMWGKKLLASVMICLHGWATGCEW